MLRESDSFIGLPLDLVSVRLSPSGSLFSKECGSSLSSVEKSSSLLLPFFRYLGVILVILFLSLPELFPFLDRDSTYPLGIHTSFPS